VKSDHPHAAPQDARATLMYAGAIAGRARFDVVSPERTNLNFEPHEVIIRDVRSVQQVPTIEREGFAFLRQPSQLARSGELFEGNLGPETTVPALNAAYLEETGQFLTRITGAKQIIAQIGGLVIRTSARTPRKSWALPANMVHLDFTAKSARQFLDWSAAAQNLQLPDFDRLVVYQTWRAVSPAPQDSTLCICDGSSVQRTDAVVFDSVLGPEDAPGKFFEARLCRYRDTHRWYYLPAMTPDDLLLFKGFDSAMPLAMNAMHSAFDNPHAGEDAVPRRSIEARFLALFD
jgi:hypothetical protein